MEEALLNRLLMLSNEVKRISDQTSTLSPEGEDDKRRAEITAAKLKKLLDRLNNDLNNYFRLVNQPSADDISQMSQIQLEAEQNLAELEVKLKMSTQQPQNSADSTSSRLPKLNLPEFNGDILSWHQFWDQFSSNIDKRNMAEVDKLLYLKASVKGEAKRAIDGLETTNRNYHIALQTLKDRYANPSHLVDAHYAALYGVKPAGKTIMDCRNTLNNLERHLRVLESLKEDVNHNHLRHLIFEKFPEDLIYELKMKTSNNSINEVRKHLEKIITAREDASRITTDRNYHSEYTIEALHTTQVKRRQTQIPSSTGKGPAYQDKGMNARFNNNPIPVNRTQRETRKRVYEERNNVKGCIKRIDNMERKRRKLSCIFCKGNHFNDQCTLYKDIKDRKLKLKNRCYGCLRRGHNRAICPRLIKKEEKTSTEVTMTSINERGSTALQTAVVPVKKLGSTIETKCRILFDSGSQRSYIIKEVADKLNLEEEQEDNLIVFTFGTRTPQKFTSPVVKLELKTRYGSSKIIQVNVVPMISHGVPYPMQELSGLENKGMLADDGSLFDRIDILIGNDYYFSFMSLEKRQLNDNLFLVNSEFGWILSGRLEEREKPMDILSVVTYFQSGIDMKLSNPDPPIDQGNVSFLWELESIGINDSPKTSRDEQAIDNFNETTKIINKRYTVSWPWNEYPPSLPSNYGLAYGRLVNLIKRLDEETLLIYDKTLKEQIDKGIIEIVEESTTRVDHPVHYLPHHCVTQKDKPIRIVYDASAKTNGGKSLNQCLYCGPLMLEDLTGLLIRFRTHRVALSADVEKAFLQIALHETDRDVTRFFWVKDLTKPATKDNIQCMRFCRVPFGIISSPFILNATIRHHLNRSNQPRVKNIANDIYVDNLVTGASSTEEAVELYRSSKEAFQLISMNLREWNSNSEEFMERVPDSGKDNCVKILGLEWNLKEDTLRLRYAANSNVNTKRGVLKTIASIYDPCGYAIPYILSAKLFLQELWKGKMKWDEGFPEGMVAKWSEIRKELGEIPKITVPRCYVRSSNDCQLHCFTDASLQAYAAALYIVNGKERYFIMGKSRLVPLKDQDNLKIPRLELLGLVIGNRLIKFAMKHLNIKIISQTLWTDSKIVIDWHKSSKLLPPFVARRIEELKQNKELIIRYVPSELNPADVATRPLSSYTGKIKWLEGPNFLSEEPKVWPTDNDVTLVSSLTLGEGLTMEKVPQDYNENLTMEEIPQEYYDKGLLNEEILQKENLHIDKEYIKRLQAEFFPQETQGKETDLSRNLRLFKDEDGILRCKGRLRYANWPFDKRFPILIPKNNDYTKKLILQTHNDNYHVGVNHTLSIIRQCFWIPQGRSQVQKILRGCPRCIKHGGGPFKLPLTPDLPAERVNYSSPFTFVGVDYMGPLLVNTGNGSEKRWVCLFTCLAVRAIHLEVVQNLTAEEGLLALRRMISNRGVPTLITSDNALHFKLMSEILTSQYCIQEKIQWRFIPQLAPWFGGFYERLIGMVKNCMKKTLQKHLLNDSQLTTFVKEIEAVINTRPLTCVGSELDHILKPSDFLTVGKCLTTDISDKEHMSEGTTTKTELIHGWKRALVTLQEFKEMFQNQYLPSLRERYQHSKGDPRVVAMVKPKVGQIVQIKGETKNREGWKVGKIITLVKGSDGQNRIAKVKVGNKEFTRSITHLYPLEIEEESKDSKERFETNEDINKEKDQHENERESKSRRGAATKALEKIREWTRSLLTQF